MTANPFGKGHHPAHPKTPGPHPKLPATSPDLPASPSTGLPRPVDLWHRPTSDPAVALQDDESHVIRGYD